LGVGFLYLTELRTAITLDSGIAVNEKSRKYI
jgi:hypothetical protein